MDVFHVALLGIIPARAGFTRTGRAIGASSWDHPRSRGVYPTVCVRPLGLAGSSPLARGLLLGLSDNVTYVGIIPARAGFTRHHRYPTS